MGEQFEIFWQAYPKRTPHANPKKPASKAFDRLVKRGAKPDQLIEGAAQYAKYCKAHVRDRQYIAMAATFLNQERFNDFLEESAPVTLSDIISAEF
tara:strand:+ start:186 stop:473 length:288 start_codon:yes stop_codon:yes gene_type:complete